MYSKHLLVSLATVFMMAAEVPHALAQRAAWLPCRDAQSAEEKVPACSRAIAALTDGVLLERAYLRRGNAYLERNMYAEAIDDFTKLIAMRPSLAGYYDNRQAAYRRFGNFDAALSDANMAVHLSPKLTFAYRSRGGLFESAGRFDEAFRDFTTAIGIDPKDAGLHDLRGKILLKQGKLEPALQDFMAALTIDPKAIYALKGRAIAQLRLGDVTNSLGDIQKYVTTYPDDTEAAAILASIERINSNPPATNPNLTQAVTMKLQRSPLDDTSSQSLSPSVALPLDRRVALVFGNSAYQKVPVLTNPKRDASAIAEALNRLGFDYVKLITNADQAAMLRALSEFSDEATNADWALIYFAGHGLEVGGENYLVPIDASITTDKRISFEAASLDQFMSAISGAKKLKLIILDACRENPFSARMKANMATRTVNRGLARVEPVGGTMVAYAARDGQVARDGDGDGHSPYAEALLSNIATPNVEINLLFRRVRDYVLAKTGQQQEPFVYGSLPGDEFYFSERK